MSKKTKPAADPAPRPMSRARVVLSGVALGAVWGSLMWAAFELMGRGSGPRGLVYLAFTIAMIGGGVAAVFGAIGARRGGERVSPRVPGADRRDRKP